MMLGPYEVLLIAGTTFAATAVVTVLTVLVLRLTPHSGIAVRCAVVLAGSLVSIVVSTLAVAAEMYLSGHDVVVLAYVIGISALMSMIAGWAVTGRAIRSPVEALVADARRVGDGDVVAASLTGWREFDEVSAELAETSRRLADARAQIAELDAARRQFFAWISHDLRTPLAGMRAMAEALENGTAAEPGLYIATIRTKVDTINKMVDDLFQLSKLQTGSLELCCEPVVLRDLVSDAVADVQAIAIGRGIRIVDDGIYGHVVWADPREITRAIGNLLSNAVRHAPDDSTITVRAVGDDATLVLSVVDQGEGVSSEDLGSIFDVGWRADTARTSDRDDSATTGAGLGLAIVRGIVEAHGGTIRAQRTAAGFQLDLELPTAAAG